MDNKEQAILLSQCMQIQTDQCLKRYLDSFPPFILEEEKEVKEEKPTT